MIIKQAETDMMPSDPRHRAGVEAERQMAFYLHRDFAADPNLFVLNNIRLVDPERPEHDGRPGVCQIDHLLLHRWGAFIIESKSVTDEISVRDDGAGGDEWTRAFRGREEGFPSPIQQARRQGEFLRGFLQRHRESLLGKMPTGFRTLGKLIAGTDQRGFSGMPIQIIVAVSDRGKIRRVNKWQEPVKPFKTFVSKADTVGEKVRDELAKHKASSSVLAASNGDYGIWAMKAEEIGVVADLLKSNHQPFAPAQRRVQPGVPADPPVRRPDVGVGPAVEVERADGPRSVRGVSEAACRGCGGSGLTASWGKYGYYWKCDACGVNTTMPTTCSACGAQGQRGQVVRIRKDGPKYFRACTPCGIEECVWVERR